MASHGKSLSKEIERLSNDELEKYLQFVAEGTPGRKLALEEVNRRRSASSSKPRWNIAYAVAVAIVFAIVGAVFIARWIDQSHNAQSLESAEQSQSATPE